MTDKSYWESFKAEGENVIGKVRDLIHQGNVRRVLIQQEGLNRIVTTNNQPDRRHAESTRCRSVVSAYPHPRIDNAAALTCGQHRHRIQVDLEDFGNLFGETRHTEYDLS
jgi:hypothetical protein